MPACLCFCRGQIPQGGRNGVEQRVDQNVQEPPYHHVVGVQPGRRHAHKLGNQQIVRVENRHGPDAVQQHSPHIAADFPQRFRGQRADVFLPQVGKQPVCLGRSSDILHCRRPDGEVQIIQIISGQKQRGNLRRRGNQRHSGPDGSLYVFLLMHIEQGGFIGKEIGDAGINHIQSVDQRDMGNPLRHLLHKEVQKRGQGQPQRENQQADNPVDPAVQPDQGLDRLRVPMGRRAVKAVGNGDAEPQLRQGEHGQDVCKQSVQPQILLPQQKDEHPAGHKFQRRQQQLAGHGIFDIFCNMFRSVHPLPSPHPLIPQELAQPVDLAQSHENRYAGLERQLCCRTLPVRTERQSLPAEMTARIRLEPLQIVP